MKYKVPTQDPVTRPQKELHFAQQGHAMAVDRDEDRSFVVGQMAGE